LNESITVVGSSPILDTDSARISETIGKRAVSDLPLNGRNVWSLATTTPASLPHRKAISASVSEGRASAKSRTACRSTGSTSSSNLLGGDQHATDRGRVTEIQVQTGSTSAEYGSYLGVHVNVVTRAGPIPRTDRCSSSSRMRLSTIGDTSRIRRTPRTRGGATSSARRSTVL
jgi:hypothetical protein